MATKKRPMTIDTMSAASVSPHTNPLSPPQKVVVAKSDFEHALEAFDTVMANNWLADEHDNTNKKSTPAAAQDKKDDAMDIEEKEHEQEKHKMTCKQVFLSHVQSSLKERLCQIANPIDDEAFHKLYRDPILQEQIQQEQEEEECLLAEEEAVFQAQEEAQKLEEFQKEDFDEQELIDEEALKRARELRVQVRDMAARMKLHQESVLEKAVQLAQREIRLLAEDILLQDDIAKSEVHVEEESKAAHAEANAARRKVLQQMKESLKTLTNSIQYTVGGALPKNLRNMKDTLQVVDKSLEKRKQPESLSQTEQAILSRSNEGGNDQSYLQQSNANNMGKGHPALIEQDSNIDRNVPELVLGDFLGAY